MSAPVELRTLVLILVLEVLHVLGDQDDRGGLLQWLRTQETPTADNEDRVLAAAILFAHALSDNSDAVRGLVATAIDPEYPGREYAEQALPALLRSRRFHSRGHSAAYSAVVSALGVDRLAQLASPDHPLLVRSLGLRLQRCVDEDILPWLGDSSPDIIQQCYGMLLEEPDDIEQSVLLSVTVRDRHPGYLWAELALYDRETLFIGGLVEEVLPLEWKIPHVPLDIQEAILCYYCSHLECRFEIDPCLQLSVRYSVDHEISGERLDEQGGTILAIALKALIDSGMNPRHLDRGTCYSLSTDIHVILLSKIGPYFSATKVNEQEAVEVKETLVAAGFRYIDAELAHTAFPGASIDHHQTVGGLLFLERDPQRAA